MGCAVLQNGSMPTRSGDESSHGYARLSCCPRSVRMRQQQSIAHIDRRIPSYRATGGSRSGSSVHRNRNFRSPSGDSDAAPGALVTQRKLSSPYSSAAGHRRWQRPCALQWLQGKPNHHGVPLDRSKDYPRNSGHQHTSSGHRNRNPHLQITLGRRSPPRSTPHLSRA